MPALRRTARMPTPAKTLYLLDAMALAYRSHFIFINRPLTNSKGENTSATYGFTNSLLKLIDDHRIEHLAVVFDAAGDRGTFRSDLYADYKAHRPPMPDDLRQNLPWIEEVVEAFDVPCVKAPGVEADDAIGALARKAEAEGANVVIVSPDKDFRQLISDHVSIFRPAHRGESFDTLTIEGFRERYGLEPAQFVDVLALMGDASDNVPGVPGIGEKTAIDLVQGFGSVEALLDRVDEVKGKKAREGLQANPDKARLSKELVTIKTDVDVPLDWDRLAVGTHDHAALVRIFERLEFRSLTQRFANPDAPGGTADLFDVPRGGPRGGPGGRTLLPDDDPALAFDFGLNVADGAGRDQLTAIGQYDPDATAYTCVRSRADLAALAADLAAHPVVAMDTETTSTNAMEAGLVGLSFAWAEGQGVYVPVPLPDGTSEADLLGLLRPFYEGPALKVGQNLKYDLLVLARAGVEVAGPLFDTLVAHYLVAPEEPHALDTLARKYLSYRPIPITDLIGTGKNQKSMRDVPLDLVVPYACEDADVTLRLYPILKDALAGIPGLTAIAETIEFPLVPVLVAMERAGIRVDAAVLADISRSLDAQLVEIRAQLFAEAGREFNLNSPDQLGAVLFDEMGLKAGKKTATGKRSTSEQVLAELAVDSPFVTRVLDYRRLFKLKSTYTDALQALVNPETGRVHTQFNQTRAVTGRLSSDKPNLQNIPIRTEVGREVRRAFVPEAGWVLLSADYVQIELRILAALSGDEGLRAAFAASEDIHTAAAARVYDVPASEVTRDQRRKAKEVNYGIPYGVSAFGLAQRLRGSRQEAADLIEAYRAAYPRVMAFLGEVLDEGRRKGYVETMLGRRRYVPNLRAANHADRGAAEREAVNMPIQGSQADMIKRAMVALHARLRADGYRARMLLQVHDELVFEAPPDEVERLTALIHDAMTTALPLPHGVPVEVEVGTGPNWLDAH